MENETSNQEELAKMQAIWQEEARTRELSGLALEGYISEQQRKYQETKSTGRYFPGVRVVTPATEPDPGILDTAEIRAARIEQAKQ